MSAATRISSAYIKMPVCPSTPSRSSRSSISSYPSYRSSSYGSGTSSGSSHLKSSYTSRSPSVDSRYGISTYSNRYSSSSSYGTPSSYRSSTYKPRPLPPGPGPLDAHGRKMSISALDSKPPRSNSYGISSRSGPLKGDHSYSTYSGTTSSYTPSRLYSPRSSSVGRHYRASTVDNIANDLDNTHIISTSRAHSRSRSRYRSLTDLNDNTISDKCTDKSPIDDILENNRTSSITKSVNYYNTSAKSYDYDNSSEKITDALPEINGTSSSPSRTASTTNDETDLERTANSRKSMTSNSRTSSSNSVTSVGNGYQGKVSSIGDDHGTVGLRNLGNTCFMNSVLQSLSNTRMLLEYCIKDNYHLDINKSTSNMKGQLMTAYAKMMDSMWKSKYENVVSPSAFKSQIQKFASRFMGYNQQDAHEFLIYLLEGLHEDVNRVAKRPKPIIANDEEEDKLSDADKAREYWKRYLAFDNSKIVDVFVGQLKSTLRCTTCDYASVTFDPFWDISLPIPKRGSDVKLEDCFKLFTQEEVLDDDERPTCARCKARRRCTKSFTIHKFPKVLVLHLKRFSQGNYFRNKLSTHVDFPTTRLDLHPFAAERNSNCIYNLYAVSNHSGTTYSGHYTATCKHPYSGQWHDFNDTRVSQSSAKSAVTQEAYVLFYELASETSRL